MKTGLPFRWRPYAKINVGPLVCAPALHGGHDSVVRDPYVKDGTRFKDIARFTMRRGKIRKFTHSELFHPINSQSYGGYSSRSYHEIPGQYIDSVLPIAELFMRLAGISNGREVLLQRQRVVNDSVVPSMTVREGLHRDGVSKLGIFCVARVNIEGGVSLIYDDKRDLTFASTLEPGDLLLMDDERVWHDTTPILRSDVSHPGIRDIIILTWPASRESDVSSQR